MACKDISGRKPSLKAKIRPPAAGLSADCKTFPTVAGVGTREGVGLGFFMKIAPSTPTILGAGDIILELAGCFSSLPIVVELSTCVSRILWCPLGIDCQNRWSILLQTNAQVSRPMEQGTRSE